MPSFDISSLSKRFGPGPLSVKFNPLSPNINKQIQQAIGANTGLPLNGKLKFPDFSLTFKRFSLIFY